MVTIDCDFNVGDDVYVAYPYDDRYKKCRTCGGTGNMDVGVCIDCCGTGDYRVSLYKAGDKEKVKAIYVYDDVVYAIFDQGVDVYGCENDDNWVEVQYCSKDKDVLQKRVDVLNKMAERWAGD